MTLTGLRKLMASFRGYDPLPLLNDGLCPFCGKAQGPKIGKFGCVSCDRFVPDNDLARNIALMTWKHWERTGLGGLGIALAAVGCAALLDPKVGDGLARLWSAEEW